MMDDFKKDADLEQSYFPEGTVHEDEYFYLDELKFVWDKAKNEVNIREHGVDFKTAALVFNDPYALEDYDYSHSEDEDRSDRIGVPVDLNDTMDIPGFEGVPRAFLGAVDNVLFVVYTMRFIAGSEYHRIISARAAEKEEIEEYEAAKLADMQW